MRVVAMLFSIGILLAALAATGCDSGHATANGSPTATHTTARAEISPEPSAPKESEQLLEKTFDDIKFDIEPDAPFFREMLTPEIEELGGKRIRIRGYIYPPNHKLLKRFTLVRDNKECCFGPGAALYDCIMVEMKPGEQTKYNTSPIAVTGVFSIKELKIGNTHLAIYRMVDAEVE